MLALGHYVLMSVSESEEHIGGSVGLIISMGKKYYLESMGDEVCWPALVTIGSEIVLADEDAVFTVTDNLYATLASNVVCIDAV